MKKDNNDSDSKIGFRLWLIKKLFSNQIEKEDLLKLLSEKSDVNKDYNDLDDNNENKLIKNILNLNHKTVEDVMVPRAEIIAIEKNQNIKQILSIIEIEAHSRMPVYNQNLDNILGFVHIKDVFKNINLKNFDINNILREVLYVAPKSPILDLLKRMRSSRIHMSLVVDEFGGVDGLVTIEDLVEEIVGEIEDEHDIKDDFEFKKISNSKFIFNANYKLIDLENIYKIKINEIIDEEIDTLGGLVFFLAGKVPKQNEMFHYKNLLSFKVLSATDRRINSLEVDKV
tara:strand:- start:12694 stop:13548 length:855 start_codon:yes stop_codon:yes gene_type:complete